MTIAHLVTRGYGTGTLTGTIAAVVLRGYIPGAEAVVEETTGGGWLSPEQVRRLHRIAKRADKDREADRKAKWRERDRRRQEIESAYDAIHRMPQSEAATVVAEVVREFSAPSDSRLPPMEAIDWRLLADSADAVARLSEALIALSARWQRDEEEAVALLFSEDDQRRKQAAQMLMTAARRIVG